MKRVIFFLLIVCGWQLNAQEATNDENTRFEFPELQSDIVKKINAKEMQSDAYRRLVYLRELVADKHYARALEKIEEFLVLYPIHRNSFDAYVLSARAQEGLGSTMLAASAYKNAFYKASDEARGIDAYLRAGKLLAENGDIRQARQIFEHINKIRPSSEYSRQAEFELSSFPVANAMDLQKKIPAEESPSKVDDGLNSKNSDETGDSNETPLIDLQNSKTDQITRTQNNKNSNTDNTPKQVENQTNDRVPGADTKQAAKATAKDLVGEGILLDDQ